MKKIICSALVLVMMLALVACPVPQDIFAKSEGVMSWEEYNAAELGAEVVVEAFIQGKQAWWAKDGVGRGTFYLQDNVGGYLAYELLCTEEEYNQLAVGTKVRLTGYKDMWSGEVEIIDCHFIALESEPYVAEAKDLTDKLGTDELVKYQNQLVTFTGLTVEEISYKAEGDDIYVKLSYNGATYSFCVEKYLTGPDTDLYKAVGQLKKGDVVDVTGFLYWYEGPNTHITAVTVK